jgi:hypothetical protein
VDAAKIGPGLSWEIERVREIFGPDNVIFCLPKGDVAARQHLEAKLDNWYPQRRRFIEYPPSASPTEVDNVAASFVTQVAECLACREIKGKLVNQLIRA